MNAAPKPDWKSKTIIGIAASLVAMGLRALLPDADINVDEIAVLLGQVVEVALRLIEVGGLLFAWYGRRVAKAPVRIRKDRAPEADLPADARSDERVWNAALERMPPNQYGPAGDVGGDDPQGRGDEFWGRNRGPFLD